MAVLLLSLVFGAVIADPSMTSLEPREVYKDNRLVAKGLEFSGTLQGNKHFFSHAEDDQGKVTEIDSWSDNLGNPISARYFMGAGATWTRITVTIQNNDVKIIRESSGHQEDRSSTLSIDKDHPTLLAQFDPERTLHWEPITSPVHLSLIDPVNMRINQATVSEQHPQNARDTNRYFTLTTEFGSGSLSFTSDGRLIQETSVDGYTYRPAAWSKFYFRLAQKLGLQTDPALSKMLNQSYSNTPPNPGIGRRRG